MKRYRLNHDNFSECICEMEEDRAGEWINANEAEKLEERIRELEEKITELRRGIEGVAEIDKLNEEIRLEALEWRSECGGDDQGDYGDYENREVEED